MFGTRLLFAAWSIAVAASAAGGRLSAADAAAVSAPMIELRGRAQGTTYSIKVVAALDPDGRRELQREIDDWLARFDAAVSTYRDDSELVRFNASAGDDWFPVSVDTAAVVARALEIARLSDGAFDPTVAPLLKLWRFDRSPGQPSLPTEAAILQAQARIGWRHAAARIDPPALRKSLPELELNLNAIAPGYSVDQVARLLQERGVRDFMIEIGGEVRCGGRKPDRSSWRIGIERPAEGAAATSPPAARALQAALPIDDVAVATSGDYRQFFVIDGVRHSHAIDPATGRPATHGLASVTVLAEDCMSADGFATALMVLGPQRGLELAERERLAVLMLVRQPDGALAERMSTAFAEGVGRKRIDLSQPGPAETARSPQSPARAAVGDAPPGDIAPVAGLPTLDADQQPPASAWSTVMLAVGGFTAAMLGLAAGLILRGKPLPGSCGGLAGMRDEHGHPACPSCTVPRDQCAEFRKQVAAAAEAPADGEQDAVEQS